VVVGVVANVGINVDARSALQRLKQIASRGKEVEKTFTDVNGRLSDSKGRFAAAGDAANKASSSFGKLVRTTAKLALAYASLNAAQNAVRTGIARIESERRIEFLAKGYGEVAELQDAATQSAKRFGTGQTEANRALADVFARLRPVGTSLEDIVSVYNGFNTAARISGSTAVESANAFRQLSQALGSGALRGDEFNSISEQVPGILTAIAQETGVAQGKLREFAADGGITADVVIRALKRIETEGAEQLEAALGGPSQAIADFQNAAEDVQVALTRDIVPQMAAAFRGLAELIVNLEGPIRFIGKIAGDTLNQINSLIVAATQPGAASARRDIESGLLPLNVAGTEELFRGTGPQGRGLQGLREQSTLLGRLRGQDRKKVLLQLMQDRLATMAAVNQVQGTDIAKPVLPSFTMDGASGKAKSRAGGTGQTPKEREDISQAMYDLELKRLKARRAGVKLQEIFYSKEIETLGIIEQQLQPREEQLRLLLAEQDALEAAGELLMPIYEGAKDLQKAATGAGKAFAEMFIEADNARLLEQAQQMYQIYNQIGQAISTGIVDAITSAVEGTKTLGEVATDVLKNIANLLLNTGINLLMGSAGGGGLLGALFPKLPGRANGGPVTGSKPYVVGERGPELFVPRSSGTIIPNDKMMGGTSNVVVNVDASGSKVEGDSDRASQFGKAIGAAIQAELIKQKRPGGLLANT